MSIFLFSKNAQVPTETPCRGTSLLMLDDDIPLSRRAKSRFDSCTRETDDEASFHTPRNRFKRQSGVRHEER